MKARKKDRKRAEFATVLMRSLIVCCAVGLYSGCEGRKMDLNEKQKGTERITKDEWEKVAASKIYFGHRSVGRNILNGIAVLMEGGETARVDIVETTDPAKFGSGVFAHSAVGENSLPESKIKAFEEILRSGVGNRVDIAMLKFCFVDVGQDTDVNGLFKVYKEAIDRLEKEFPGVTFVHVTIPLTRLKTSWKTWIKKMLGKEKIWEIDQMVRKNQFNDLIRDEYSDTGALFDLAEVESTRADGTKETFEWKGKLYKALVPAYTDDGGHLNELGQKVVATKLIRFLAKQK